MDDSSKSISINGKELSHFIGELGSEDQYDGALVRETINMKRPIFEDFITFRETYNWNDDVMDITSQIIQGADESRLSNIASHFQVDLYEIREFLEMKRQQKQKPITNADRIRAMTDEELANWIERIRVLCGNDACGQACPLKEVCYSMAAEPTETLDWLKQEAGDEML